MAKSKKKIDPRQILGGTRPPPPDRRPWSQSINTPMGVHIEEGGGGRWLSLSRVRLWPDVLWVRVPLAELNISALPQCSSTGQGRGHASLLSWRYARMTDIRIYRANILKPLIGVPLERHQYLQWWHMDRRINVPLTCHCSPVQQVALRLLMAPLMKKSTACSPGEDDSLITGRIYRHLAARRHARRPRSRAIYLYIRLCQGVPRRLADLGQTGDRPDLKHLVR